MKNVHRGERNQIFTVNKLETIFFSAFLKKLTKTHFLIIKNSKRII